MPVLVAESLPTSAFLDVILNQRRSSLGSALAIRDDRVPARVLVAEFADVPSEVLMWFTCAHLVIHPRRRNPALGLAIIAEDVVNAANIVRQFMLGRLYLLGICVVQIVAVVPLSGFK